MSNVIDQQERRSTSRTTSVYRPALILTDDFSGFCMIRDISQIGVNVRAFASLATGQNVTVAFNERIRAEGQVVWAENNLIGINFHESIDPASILTGSPDGHAKVPDRPLRLDIDCDGSVKTGGQIIPMRLRDISQRGFKAAVSGLSVGDETVVYLPDFPAKRAVVRWTQYGIAGLHFDVPIRYDDLANWAVQLNEERRS